VWLLYLVVPSAAVRIARMIEVRATGAVIAVR
jgi:hypothetical protein